MNCVDAGNVLVHFFLQSKTHYALTNKKLQYMLIIAQMARLSCGRTLFDDDIRNFRHSFVLDAVGNSFMTGPDLVKGKVKDTPLKREEAGFILPYTNKRIFEISKIPSIEDKDLLASVFLAFGAYSENTLCRYLGEFKTLRNVTPFSVVPKPLISNFFSEAIIKNRYPNNNVFKFIKEQYLIAASAEKKEQNAMPVSTVQEPQKEEPKLQTQEIPANHAASKTSVLLDAEKPETAQVEVATLASDESTETVCACASSPSGILKGLSSLQSVVPGKQYSVLVELPSPKFDCLISVIATDSNRRLPVTSNMLTDTLCCFTFDAVASDIKISARVIS